MSKKVIKDLPLGSQVVYQGRVWIITCKLDSFYVGSRVRLESASCSSFYINGLTRVRVFVSSDTSLNPDLLKKPIYTCLSF